MSERVLQHNVRTALDRCTDSDRRTLSLLARLPFLWAQATASLDGLAGPAAVYRSLARLEASGLVECRRVPLRAGASPRLYFPTDLGLAAAALDRDAAHRFSPWRTRSRDLVA